MNFMKQLQQKAKSAPKKVVYPESGEEKILRAAREALNMGIAHPILIGKKETILGFAQGLGISLDGMEFADHMNEGKLNDYTNELIKLNDVLSAGAASLILKDPLSFAAMMLHQGEADAMVAGLTYATEMVIMMSKMIVGMQEGIETPSSIFLMKIPGYEGPEGDLLVFADCGVVPDPNPSELADIAISSAGTVRTLLGWEPRVALLSFSTKGSAQHPKVEFVLEALKIIQEREPNLCVDGELQVDAAIVPEVAAKKVPDGSPVAGRANILIFPDLNAGNMAYKLVQRLAKADAYGPFLQGFAKTVSDLSRGSSTDDIVGVTTMAVVRAQML